MHITKLALRDFRNFEALTLEDLNPGINVFAGRNAMGKTNLLEAVNYLSCARSFRGAPDAKLIRDGQAFAGIFAQYAADSHRGKIEIGILGEGKRSVRLNGLPVRKISELMGALNSIVFAPEDLRIIKEAPSLRRRMMDMELCKISPGYYRSLQSYSLALKSKNKLLKNPRADAGVLSAYSEQMAAYGEQMIEERAAFVEQLNACTARFYHNLQGVSEGIEIRYKCSAEVENARESLLAKMQANAAREREMGVCLTGPHQWAGFQDLCLAGAAAHRHAGHPPGVARSGAGADGRGAGPAFGRCVFRVGSPPAGEPHGDCERQSGVYHLHGHGGNEGICGGLLFFCGRGNGPPSIEKNAGNPAFFL